MCFSRRAGTREGRCSLAEAQQVFPVSRTGARLSLTCCETVGYVLCLLGPQSSFWHAPFNVCRHHCYRLMKIRWTHEFGEVKKSKIS